MILKGYSGDSDHYYCAVNRVMDTVRLSKEHVQVFRDARFPLGRIPSDCSTVAGFSVRNVSHVCK